MAPELYDCVPYSYAADIWALGVLLYKVCSLKYPFQPEDGKYASLGKMVRSHEKVQIPSCYSETLAVLINNLLAIDSSKRPNIDQILQNSH